MVGMEALQSLRALRASCARHDEGVVRGRLEPHPVCAHLDLVAHGLWQAAMPLGDLSPNHVTQLILAVRRDRNLAGDARQDEPEIDPGLKGRFADAVICTYG